MPHISGVLVRRGDPQGEDGHERMKAESRLMVYKPRLAEDCPQMPRIRDRHGIHLLMLWRNVSPPHLDFRLLASELCEDRSVWCKPFLCGTSPPWPWDWNLLCSIVQILREPTAVLTLQFQRGSSPSIVMSAWSQEPTGLRTHSPNMALEEIAEARRSPYLPVDPLA